METYIHLLDEKRRKIYSTLPNKFIEKFQSCKVESEIFVVDGNKYRHGLILNKDGFAYLITNDREIVDRPRLFKEKLKVRLDLLMVIKNIQISTKARSEVKNRRIIHNLRTLNAHNIQDLYSIIPEDLLIKTKKEERKKFIEYKIKEEISKIPSILMNIMKNNIGIKTEFSVAEKLYGPYQKPKRTRHEIKNALMSILHLFFQDFHKKNVSVEEIEDCNQAIMLDYEIFQVVMYQIFDNAIKYTKEDSSIKITFFNKEDYFFISIEMLSLYIENEELEKLTKEGYRGREAKKVNKKGQGIGMFLVKELLELEQAEIKVFTDGIGIIGKDGVKHSRNKFLVKYPKKLLVK